MERFATLFTVAGLAFFGFSVFAMGIGSIGARGLDYDTIEEMAQQVPAEFEELAKTYPARFEAAFGSKEANPESFAKALKMGRDAYIADACWHCHSQFVRPVGNEYLRWGEVATADEAYNELQMPVLYGTRRVGPDLSREGGRRPNGWHIAHFWEPTEVVPTSVMPSFKWFFDKTGRFEVKNGRNEQIAVFAARADAEALAKTRNDVSFQVLADPYRVVDTKTKKVVEYFQGKDQAAAYIAEKGIDGRLEESSLRVYRYRIMDNKGVVQGQPVLVEPQTEERKKELELFVTDQSDKLNASVDFDKPFAVAEEFAPNERGLAIVAYIQWLGTWRPKPVATEQVN